MGFNGASMVCVIGPNLIICRKLNPTPQQTLISHLETTLGSIMSHDQTTLSSTYIDTGQ